MVDMNACVLVRVACGENGSCGLRCQPLALETVQIGNSSISRLEVTQLVCFVIFPLALLDQAFGVLFKRVLVRWHSLWHLGFSLLLLAGI